MDSIHPVKLEGRFNSSIFVIKGANKVLKINAISFYPLPVVPKVVA